MFEFNEKSIYNIIIGVYLFIGLLYTLVDKVVPNNYIVLVIFITLKMLFNYKNCTISYLECKMRGVKREDGYLASLLDHAVDLRNSKLKLILYAISATLIMHTEFIKNKIKL